MGTVAKALTLLGLFTRQRREIGLSDVARLGGLNKATALRLLRELESAGLVEQLASNRAYRLGPGVLRLAALREAAVPFREFAEPVLAELSDKTRETAHLGVMQGGRRVPLSHVQSTAHTTRVIMDDIDVLDFHATGSGLAVLAYSAPAFVDDVLSRPLERFAAKTMTDPEAVRSEIARIQARGYSRSQGGMEDDLDSVSAPFFDGDGTPQGAITVVAPANRMSDAIAERTAVAVVAAANRLTRDTGGVAPADYPKVA